MFKEYTFFAVFVFSYERSSLRQKRIFVSFFSRNISCNTVVYPLGDNASPGVILKNADNENEKE